MRYYYAMVGKFESLVSNQCLLEPKHYHLNIHYCSGNMRCPVITNDSIAWVYYTL